MDNSLETFLQDSMGMIATFGLVIAVLFVWSAVWKALALWRAAKNGHKGWFVALFVINTAGILEILYLYVWGKEKES